jgi:DNA uptake protein ComE-like DNA-binding protein
LNVKRGLAVVALLCLLLGLTLPVVADDADHYDPHKTTTTKADEHTTTTHHDDHTTTTKADEHTTTTKKDETTTTKFDDSTTTTKADDTTTTKPGETTTTQGSTTTTEGSTTTGPTSPPTSEPPTVTPFCVDVNTAPQAELEQLDGISPVLALLIINNRPYETVSDLADVLSPGVFLLILIANADTGAFASDDCITPTGPPLTILICHLPPGNPENVQVIELPLENWLAGIGHGPGQHGGDFAILNEEDIVLCTGTVVTTTTSTSTTSTTTTTTPGLDTTTTAPTTTTTSPPFVFGAAASVCVAEVPTIRIVFQNTFPELAGQTGTLTMADINGNVVSTQSLVYQPNTTVDLLYPGTAVNADGSIDDVPGWILTDDELWVRDPSDAFLREGINLTYTVNPTATAFITYPPESSACANPENPPGAIVFTPSPEDGILPLTGDNLSKIGALGGAAMLIGLLVLAANHRGRWDETDS